MGGTITSAARLSFEESREKQSPRRHRRGLGNYSPEFSSDCGKSSKTYCVGAAVVFGALVFFVFATLVFFVFAAVVVVSCANTGIASENATMAVKSNVRSFFILGLDLPLG